MSGFVHALVTEKHLRRVRIFYLFPFIVADDRYFVIMISWSVKSKFSIKVRFEIFRGIFCTHDHRRNIIWSELVQFFYGQRAAI